MEKLKDKKTVGLIAAALPIVWVLFELVRRVLDIVTELDYIFDYGFVDGIKMIFTGYLGGFSTLFFSLFVLLWGACIAFIIFMPKILKKVPDVLKGKNVLFGLAGVLGIIAIFDLFSFFRSVGNFFDFFGFIFDYGFRFTYVIYMLMNLLSILAFLAAAALVAYIVMAALDKAILKKFWYAAGGLRTIYSVLVVLLSVLVMLFDGYFAFSGLFDIILVLIGELIFALAMVATAYWVFLPCECEATDAEYKEVPAEEVEEEETEEVTEEIVAEAVEDAVEEAEGETSAE